MKKQLLTLGILAALSGVAVADGVTGSVAAGKNKNAMCQGCHGQPGWRTAFPEVYTVPKLGGQNPNYIVSALKAYKSGERAHSTMQAIAAGLTEQDIVDLAAYYAEKK